MKLCTLIAIGVVAAQEEWDEAAWEEPAWEDTTTEVPAWEDTTWEEPAWEDSTWEEPAWEEEAWAEGEWAEGEWAEGEWEEPAQWDWPGRCADGITMTTYSDDTCETAYDWPESQFYVSLTKPCQDVMAAIIDGHLADAAEAVAVDDTWEGGRRL